MKSFTFPKKERLTDKRKISQLFTKATAQSAFPLKALFSISPQKDNETCAVKVTVAVPKRAFKRAVKRNLLKRRMREAYRLHKQTLYTTALESNQIVEIVFIYLGKAEIEYPKIESSMVNLLQIITQRVSRSASLAEREKIQRETNDTNPIPVNEELPEDATPPIETSENE